MKNIKTATITWITFNNFGTFLQAYALQYTLKKMGYSNKIISDKYILKEIQLKQNRLFPFLKRVWHFIRQCFSSKYRSLYKVPKYYEAFKKKYLEIDKDWHKYKTLNDRYDCFLCGSDQIWSPNGDVHPFYYLGFTNKKKISYAPSMGNSLYPFEKIKLVKPYLEKFDFLSIREKQGARIIKEQFGLYSKVVVDPTLLLNKEEWSKFIYTASSENYVLAYFLSYNKEYLSFVREFSKSKKLKLKILVIDNIRACDYADESLFIGPQEFINEIYNSTYFFTDSFHGSIFAILFEKKFYTFQRFSETSTNNQNSRLENLFEILNLQNYFLSRRNLYKVYSLPLINYVEVAAKLKKERESSLEYLKNALNN